MRARRFVSVKGEKCIDTYNDVVMDLEDCVEMLNVAETIITGAFMAKIIADVLDD